MEKNTSEEFNEFFQTAKHEAAKLNVEVRGAEEAPMAAEALIGAELEEVVEGEDEQKLQDEKDQKIIKIHKKRLKEKLKEERQLKNLNQKKVIRKWRGIMRKIKRAELQNQIEILSQQLAFQFERYDNLLDLGLEDIVRLEEQFRTAQRSHLRKMEELAELKQNYILELNADFDRRLNELTLEFDAERENIIQNQKNQMRQMKKTFEEVQDRFDKWGESAHQAHDTEREEIRNHNLEEYNVVKITLEGKLEQIEKGFDKEHVRYMDLAEDKTREYEELKAKDTKLSKEIDHLMNKNNALQAKVSHWKKKLTNHSRECRERNDSLRKEKNLMNQHYRELKNQMTRNRRQEHERLAELTVLSREALQKNTKYLDDLCAILRLAEMCRKYETEREKVLPDEGAGEELAGQTPEFEKFWNRYNKVLLDKMILEQQEANLADDNIKLEYLIEQFKRDVGVPKDVMREDNTLLVLNGSLAMAPSDHGKRINVVEGNDVINNYTRQLEF